MIRNYQRTGGEVSVNLEPIYHSLNALQIQVNELYTRSTQTVSTSSSSTVSSEPSTVTINTGAILHNITEPGTYSLPISYDSTFLTDTITISGINCPSILIEDHTISWWCNMSEMTAELMSYRGAGGMFNNCVFTSVIADDTGHFVWFDGCTVTSFAVNDNHSYYTNYGYAVCLQNNRISRLDLYYPYGDIVFSENSISDAGVTVWHHDDYGGTIDHYKIEGTSVNLYSNANAKDIHITAGAALIYKQTCNALNASVFQTESTHRGWICSLSSCSAEYAKVCGVMYAENVRESEALVQKCTFNTFSLDHNKIQISSNSFKDIAVLNIGSGSLMFNTCTGLMEGYINSMVGRDNSLRVGHLYYRNSAGPNNTIELASALGGSS